MSKKNTEDKKPFALPLTLMRLLRLLPGEGEPERRRSARRYSVFVLGVSLSISLMANVLDAEAGSETKLAAILYVSVMVHVLYKLVVLPARGRRILNLIEGLERLYDAASEEASEAARLDRANRLVSQLPKAFMGGCLVTAVFTLGLSLYHGEQPFPAVWVPLPPDYLVLTGLLQTLLILVPCATLGVVYSVFAALSAHLIVQITILYRKMGRLLDSPDYPTRLATCVNQHVEIIRLVNEMNDIFGGLLFQEILISSVQCCLAAYKCSQRNNMQHPGDSSFYYDLAATFFTPLLICWCGEKIKGESSKIVFSIYSTDWYMSEPRIRKDLALIMTAASQPLGLHYRRIFHLDIVRYSLVLQTAYSYFTVLESLDVSSWV